MQQGIHAIMGIIRQTIKPKQYQGEYVFTKASGGEYLGAALSLATEISTKQEDQKL